MLIDEMRESDRAQVATREAAETSPSSGRYLRVRTRVTISVVAGLAWLALSIWVALVWADDLGRAITPVGAWLVIAGTALLPGYLNAQLLVAVLLDRPREPRVATPLPWLTVIVAAYNEEARIGETLDYLLRVDYPGRLEIVVADDGSIDRTREVVRGYCGRDGRVRLMAARHGGKAEVLNAALDTVRSPLIATIDADTLLTREALSRAVARLVSMPSDAVAVAGSVMVRNSRANILTRLQQWDHLIGIGSVKRGQSLQQGTLAAPRAFSVYRADALRAVGGWPDAVGEDIVLTWSLLRRGGRTGFEPTAIAFTESPATLRHLARQRRRRARGTLAGLRAHAWALVRRRRAYAHAVIVDGLVPVLDVAYLAVPAGIVLAATGRLWIVGPLALAVLPLNGLIAGVMIVRQSRAMAQVGLVVRRTWRDLLALAGYLLVYQLLMSPVAVAGYLMELAQRRRLG